MKKEDVMEEEVESLTGVSDPTTEEKKDPLFELIWQTIKDWDISIDECNSYTGATGNHAVAIYRAIKNNQ
mgnify:CR=1 FL=1